MLCVLLAAGVGNSLESELVHDEQLRGIPRALLPVGGRPMLSWWLHSLMASREILSVYLVCSAASYKHFERWATAVGLPVHNVVNNGVSSPENAMGAGRDLALALRRARSDGVASREALVIAGDSLFFKEFDLPQVIECFRRLQRKEASEETVSLVLYYKLAPNEDTATRGIVSVDAQAKRILQFQEKPRRNAMSRLACPLFYVLGNEALNLLREFADDDDQKSYSCGAFLEKAVEKTDFFGLRLPSGFSLVGVSAGIREYRELDATFSRMPTNAPAEIGKSWNRQTSAVSGEYDSFPSPKPFDLPFKNSSLSLPATSYGQAFARVGIMGNPSDGYFGKTMACTIKNFCAQVWLTESEKLRILPHTLFDPSEFGSLNDLHSIAVREGYHGGLRLLMGTCKKFFEYCLENQIALPHRNFTVKYDTNIPRQVGLSGSSAIVTALFKALLAFFGLTDEDIPKALQPSFVLSVETEEMGIAAGLQDRVAQVFQGLVFMDFDKEFMERNGHGGYEKLPIDLLGGKFFIAYRSEPSDSGKIHSNVKERFLRGEEDVVEAMEQFAGFAEDGRKALLDGNFDAFGDLMNQNFALRRQLFSDAVVGAPNIEMVEIAHKFGCAAKFPGSGGAILGLAKSKSDFKNLRKAFEDNGCVFCVLEPVE